MHAMPEGRFAAGSSVVRGQKETWVRDRSGQELREQAKEDEERYEGSGIQMPNPVRELLAFRQPSVTLLSQEGLNAPSRPSR